MLELADTSLILINPSPSNVKYQNSVVQINLGPKLGFTSEMAICREVLELHRLSHIHAHPEFNLNDHENPEILDKKSSSHIN